MGTSSYLLTVIGAAAFRFLLGVDAGMDYDSTALSQDLCPGPGECSPDNQECQDYCTDVCRVGDPIPRVPWALRIRPDILFAIFNSRQYFYITGDGSFVQPFFDTFEGSGQLIAAARLRLGHDIALHPGVFVRAASSNELLRGQTAGAGDLGLTELFFSVSGGGWLELEVPIVRRLRLMVHAEAEAFVLDWIPPEIRDRHPAFTFSGNLAALIALTQADGLAVEMRAVEGMYFPEEAEQGAEHQVSLTGRLVYRRFWLPYVMTDVALGMVGLMERDGTWNPNVAANAVLMVVGRPRWFMLNISYERRFEYVSLTSPGTMQDVGEILAAFGPFSGFSLQVALNWTRTEVEVQGRDPDVMDCAPQEFVMRPFHTIGATVEARYLYEVSDFGFGPFFEGYVFSPFAEEAPYDPDYRYLPPGLEPIEMVLLAGIRLQWGTANARSRSRSGEAGALGSGTGRAERRLAMQRMSREERSVPTFAWGAQPIGTTEADEDALFTDHDPLGRVRGEYEDELDEEEREEEERSPYEEEGFGEEEPADEPEGEGYEEGGDEGGGEDGYGEPPADDGAGGDVIPEPEPEPGP